MRNFLDSVELSDLVEGVNAWWESSMEAEDLSFNNGSQREVIEKLSELFPDIGIAVFPQAFIIEAIPIGIR